MNTEKLWKILRSSNTFLLSEKITLKTAPKGFPKDFEYIDYLKCKDYTCAYMVPDAFFLAPDLLDKVEDVFKQLKRFADFTNFHNRRL